jgi:hypothetical protein
MAFRPPNFNLTCRIWRVGGVGGAYAAPDVTSPCALSPGRRVLLAQDPNPGAGSSVGVMELLLPKLTDIRATWNAVAADVVEVPAGSKRFYTTFHVDDTGKGYLNEYRLALIGYLPAGATFFALTAPVPLP